MQLTLKPWGNSTGVRFSKEFLERAGLAQNDTVNAEIVDGRIVLTPAFAHRSLKELATAFNGQLNLSNELPREEIAGNEVW